MALVDNTNTYNPPTNVHAIFRNTENLGFAKGSNQGARRVTTPYVLFLNCDCEPQPGWLEPLLAAFDDPGVMLVGPRLIYPAGNIQCAGIRIWSGPNAGGQNRQDDHPTEDVEGLTGACVMMLKTTFDALGAWDERFWHGNEDVHMMLVAREKGYRCRYISESVVVHHESATGAERWSKTYENIALLSELWRDK